MKKWYMILATFMLIVLCHWCRGEDGKKEVGVRNYLPVTRKLSFGAMALRRIKDLGSWIAARTTGDNFVGRCFGVARKLKMIMPMMIFKMGVIITILIFLTIFSLKGLGLLITLLFVNASGIFHKVASSKESHHSPQWHSPQNVHLHVHPEKQHYGYSGSDHVHYSHSPWDRNILANRDDNSLLKRLELIELYNRLGLKYDYDSSY